MKLYSCDVDPSCLKIKERKKKELSYQDKKRLKVIRRLRRDKFFQNVLNDKYQVVDLVEQDPGLVNMRSVFKKRVPTPLLLGTMPILLTL